MTSRQKKYLYIGLIILLLIPVIFLGRPGSRAEGEKKANDPGGLLSQIRWDNDLGENSLGNVDPSSAAMNLVLLGLRGPATSYLWIQADQQKNTKNWYAMRNTIDSIILLQPHYQKVWDYQGWNLAYNVSAEWDGVRDRYYWVKEGAKFIHRGFDRNYKYPELYWKYANILGQKIGRADEWKQFRRFFKVDPDTDRYTVNGVPGPDPEINPDSQDNYLVAFDWFLKANQTIDQYGKEQHIQDITIFRSYPARSKIDYAMIRQKEGLFDETTRKAWQDAADYWANEYGQEHFTTHLDGYDFHLNWTEDEINKYAQEQGKDRNFALQLRKALGLYQNMTNYRYWFARCKAEGQPEMAAAHRELFQAQKELFSGNSEQAERLAYSGLQKLENQLKDFTTLADDDETKEEALMGILVWQDALELNGHTAPAEIPLKEIWVKEQPRVPALRTRLNNMRFEP